MALCQPLGPVRGQARRPALALALALALASCVLERLPAPHPPSTSPTTATVRTDPTAPVVRPAEGDLTVGTRAPSDREPIWLVVLPVAPTASRPASTPVAARSVAALRARAEAALRAHPPARTVAVLVPADTSSRRPDLATPRPRLAEEHLARGGQTVWVDPDPYSPQLERVDIGDPAAHTGELAPPRVELTLLVVGTGYWDAHGELGRASRRSRPPPDLRALEDELSRLRAELEASPRDVVLVSHMTLEATGVHGMGGLVGDATLRHAPAPLRAAILDGLFVGAIGGHEPELALQVDASAAIRRSTKLDVSSRLFLMEVGAASPAARRDPRRALARNRGVVLDPEIATRAPGFFVLALDDTAWHATLHTHRRGRWRTGHATAPRHDARVTGAAAQTWPSNAPCPSCDPRLTPARPQ
jgi:hypothetical protein